MADNPIKTGIMAGVSLMAKEYQKDQFKKNMEELHKLDLQASRSYQPLIRSRKESGRP